MFPLRALSSKGRREMASTLQSRADEISEVGPLLLSAALSPVKLCTGGKLKGLLRGRIVLLGVVAPSRVLCCEWKLHSEGSFLKSSVTAKRGAKGDGTVLLLAFQVLALL